MSSNSLMTGIYRYMLSIPPFLWKRLLARGREGLDRIGFMTDEHQLVHHFIVSELPRIAEPMSPEFVSDNLSIPLERVETIFDDLEKNMTFICRDNEGKALWAYPVTAEKTPHRLTFSSGEQIYAAWAVDAFATPFVQGRLRREYLSVEISSECAHCNRPMHITLDSDLNYEVKEEGCEPIIFAPDVDFAKLEDKCIIHAFWQESVFFWSEEHAREYRRDTHRLRGAYFTVDQAVLITRLAQSKLFGFDPEI